MFDSFPAPDSVVVTPYLDGTYTLEVMCSTDPTCIESVDVVITTHAEVLVDGRALRRLERHALATVSIWRSL